MKRAVLCFPILLVLLTSCKREGRAGESAGSDGDVQVKAGSGFAPASSYHTLGSFRRYAYSTVGSSIAAEWQRCTTAIGRGFGVCEIETTNEILNKLPWKADHSEAVLPRLVVHGVLTICDGQADAHGDSCAAPFSLATGNSGSIIGWAPAKATADTGSTIRAGSKERDVPLIVWGDDVPPDKWNVFGSQIRDVTVDCNNRPGMIGIANRTAQETSLLLNYNVKYCEYPIQMSSVRVNNSQMINGNITMGNAFGPRSVPLALNNVTDMRPLIGLTVQGLNNGRAIDLSTANGVAANGIGTISGISYDSSIFNVNTGPNGAPAYLFLEGFGGGASGWNTTAPITAVGKCNGNTCNSISIELNANRMNQGAWSGSASTTAHLVPSYGIVVCGGNCGAFGSNETSAPAGSFVGLQGIHLERVGVGIEVTGTAEVALEATGISCTTTDDVCVRIENNKTIRNVTLHSVSTNGYLTSIDDRLTGYSTTDKYKGEYVTGNPVSGQGPLVVFSTPVNLGNHGNAVGSGDIPECPDVGGKHLNFSNGVWSCGTK